MGLNIPRGVKIVGGNVPVSPTDQVTIGIESAFYNLYNNWSSGYNNWDNFVKKCVDYAVGNLGLNCIRMQGEFAGIPAGSYTQSQYNSYWVQFVEYCITKGVMIYPCCGWAPQLQSDTDHPLSNTQITDQINSLLATLAPYKDHIIGIDLINEANDWGVNWGEPDPTTRLIAIYNAVKPNTNFSLTYSNSYCWTGSDARNYYAGIASCLDHLDFHIYRGAGYPSPIPITREDFNYWYTNFPTCDIIAGEIGDPIDNGTSSNFQHSLYALNSFLDGGGDPRSKGALVWAIGSYTDDNSYALLNQSWVEQPQYTRPLKIFTGGHVAKPM